MVMNRTPAILWQGCQPEELVLGLKQYKGKNNKYQSPQPNYITVEVQDLLRRLFSQAESILVTSITPGFSGAGIIKVQPFYPMQGGARHFIVKFGNIYIIEQEYKRYMTYVQHFIGDGCSTVILAKARTAHLGGIVYYFVGTAAHQVENFSSFYSRADFTQVKQALDNLFRHTCRIWYANQSSLCPLDLTADYKCLFSQSMKRLEQLVSKQLPSVLFQHNLTFTSLQTISEHVFANPFPVLQGIQSFFCPSYISTTHGDFNQYNILVDLHGSTWLIDFQCTGPSHTLRDVAMLDTTIRFQLLHSHEATLDERLKMEEILFGVNQFSKLKDLAPDFSAINPAIAKLYKTIVYLRTLAGWIVERNPIDEMDEYYVALLYATINTLQFSSLELVQREHALLSASLLIEHLGWGK